VRDYIKDAAKAAPLLSLAEEQELGMRRIAGDEEARQRLIKSNLLFVVAVAKSFWASA
jgi:DNA-directed RNA polymerase sigma subunit (sigma70/sigma32)